MRPTDIDFKAASELDQETHSSCMRRLLHKHIQLLPVLILLLLLFIVYFSSEGENGPSYAILWKRAHWLAAKSNARSSNRRLETKNQKPSNKRSQHHQKISGGSVKYEGPALQNSDFVVAIPGTLSQETLLFSARASRQGVPTYYVTSYEPGSNKNYSPVANEVWSHYPDDSPQRSWYRGDTRAALAPFLAYRDVSDKGFKWLFYGDDDTLFFVEAAKSLLKSYDPSLPYFITDNLWFTGAWGGYHPNPEAPRCLPCHSSTSSTKLPVPMARGCPCRPDIMCQGAGYDRWDVKGCRGHGVTYSMHGGAGALISIGLLNQVRFEDMESCVLRQHDTGGDAFLSTCLWEQGIGFTGPDIFNIPDLPSGFTAFDPNPIDLHPDDFTINKGAMLLGPMLLQAVGHCHGPCKSIVENAVSLHLRARRTGGSQQGTAAYLRAFARLSWHLRQPSLPLTSKRHFNDTDDPISRSLAAAADSAIQTAHARCLQMVDLLSEAFPGQHKANSTLHLSRSPAFNELLLEAVGPIVDHAMQELQSAIDLVTNATSTVTSCRTEAVQKEEWKTIKQ